MKKFLAAILAIVYLSTSIGATIHFHYCMGRLVECVLTQNTSSTCSRCGMEKNPESDNRCCKDECKQIKVDTDQKLSENFTDLNGTASKIVPVIFSLDSNPIPLFLFAKLPKTNPPPRSCHTSLNIINCVLRI